MLSAKDDPLAFLQEEKAKLSEEIEKVQQEDKELEEQLHPSPKEPDPFQVSASEEEAAEEVESNWEAAKKQMAEKSRDSAFDWVPEDGGGSSVKDITDELQGAEDSGEGDIFIAKKAKKKSTPLQRRNRGYDRSKQFLAVMLILVALVVSVGGFVLDKMDLIQYENEIADDPQLEEDLQEEAAAITQEELKGLQYTDEYPSLPKGEVYRDPNVVNILLLGTDERTTKFNSNARSDSMILVSINTKTHTVKLGSFERGTGVPILWGEYQGQYDWLTHCFRYGGADLVMEEIQACYLLDVSHYIRTNIRAFMKLIDVVGGVDIYLTEAEADYINHWYNYKYATNHVREMGIKDELHSVSVGKNHLTGTTAMLYARCRAIDNDFGRMKRQRIVMQAIFNQIKDLSIPELNTMLNTILPLIQTNFSRGELATLMLQVPEIMNADFETIQLPEPSTYGQMTGMEGRSLFAVDFQKNSDDLKAFLYN